ncbi:MAG: DUF2634 domain-containing protein [Clostridia bacterium]|nr:DUF2634 domain-containing protein [Clostridia bacterium]
MTPDTCFDGPVSAARTAAQKDYAIDFHTGRIGGAATGEAALRQAIRLRLLTDRGAYPVFSERYGLPLRTLSRMNGEIYFIQLKNEITDSLLQDDRIGSVDSFLFSRVDDGGIRVSFRVLTQNGEFREETEV